MEVSLAVLAATSTTSIVFFPVTFLSGVSKYIFTPLALGVVLSIFAPPQPLQARQPLSDRRADCRRSVMGREHPQPRRLAPWPVARARPPPIHCPPGDGPTRTT